MIVKTRKAADSRKEAVRRQFRENAVRQNPTPFVQVYDAHGRPRRKPRHSSVKA